MNRKQRIYDLLSATLNPVVLEVDDESHRHQVPPNAETHFKLTIVSDRFDALPRIARHRLIHTTLHEEFKQGLHALSLHLRTTNEWQKSQTIPNSPPCHNRREDG